MRLKTFEGFFVNEEESEVFPKIIDTRYGKRTHQLAGEEIDTILEEIYEALPDEITELPPTNGTLIKSNSWILIQHFRGIFTFYVKIETDKGQKSIKVELITSSKGIRIDNYLVKGDSSISKELFVKAKRLYDEQMTFLRDRNKKIAANYHNKTKKRLL